MFRYLHSSCLNLNEISASPDLVHAETFLEIVIGGSGLIMRTRHEEIVIGGSGLGNPRSEYFGRQCGGILSRLYFT
jgi:hypothetical protein